MPLVNTMSARSRAVALKAFAAAACAAALVLSAPIRHAEATPITAVHAEAYKANANSAVHNVRVVRKVTNSTGKRVIRAGRNYDKSPNFKQVIVNGKRVPRRVDAPVVRDHRVTRPAVRDHRVVRRTVRDHRTK